MKTTRLFILLAILLGTTTVYAQPRRGNMSAEDIAKRQTTQTTEALKLDKTTSAKLYQINLKYAQKMKEAFASHSSDREAMRDEMMNIRDQKNKELQALFTSEQFKQYQEHQQEMWQHRRGMRH
jgi:periplasmic protein CpxP/Spy